MARRTYVAFCRSFVAKVEEEEEEEEEMMVALIVPIKAMEWVKTDF